MAATNDIITLTIDAAGRFDTQVSVILTSSLSSTPYDSTTFALEGDEFNSTYPYDIYLSVYARSNKTE